MTKIQEMLIQAFKTLRMANIKTEAEVPETEVILENGTKSTIREQVEILVAQETIEKLS